MGISEKIGGIPSLTAVLVVATGIIGAVIGERLFQLLRIRDDSIKGIAMGVTAHGIGTARAFNTSTEMDQRILHDSLKLQKELKQTKLAGTRPDIWRTIMKSSITKLAAGAIIVVIGLGIFTFIDTGSKSGELWAEVVQNVEASPGVIWRLRGTGSRDSNDDWPNGYKINWRSEAIARTDNYRGGQIYRTIYLNYDTKTMIWVANDAKVYNKEAMSDEEGQRARADKDRWTNPQELINCFLNLKHHALEQKTIDGVLCEGIETTDTSGLPFKSFTGRMWVSVETGYPVLLEIEAIDDGGNRHTSTLEQFRWNVDLSAGDVEPEIPAGYESLSLEGEMKTLSEQGKRELLKIDQAIIGTYRIKTHRYRYQLSDGQIRDVGEPADDMPVYSPEQWKEFMPLLKEFRRLQEAGPGENLGTYEETVEGRVFSFKREKYFLSDGTEVIHSVGTPKDGQ